MGGANSNIANFQQSFYNNITQESQQDCIATVNSETNNNVIIVQGGTINGNFTGATTTVSSDASCLMVSNMGTSVSNILAATEAQTNVSEADPLGGGQWTNNTNVFNVSQTVANNISQINKALCAANVSVSANNNYVYMSDETVNGNYVGVQNNSNAQANCSMSNNMKVQTYNQAQASGSQGNTSMGLFGAIVAMIAAVIGIIIVGVIVMFSVGAVGTIGYEYLKTRHGATAMSASDSAIKAAEALGLSADQIAAIAGTTPGTTPGTSAVPSKASTPNVLPVAQTYSTQAAYIPPSYIPPSYIPPTYNSQPFVPTYDPSMYNPGTFNPTYLPTTYPATTFPTTTYPQPITTA